MAESQIHQQYLCRLCSIVPLQYVLLMLMALARPEKKDFLGFKNLALYIYCMYMAKNIYSYAVVMVST